MPNYLEYRKSISKELISTKDRIRYFIDDHHWGEDGRYKEIILVDLLKNMLPQNVSVGTGFVMGENNQISTQIDIIVYKNDYPVLFKKSDFVIVTKECVLGIIEVKSKLESSNIAETIKKSHRNGQLIGDNIFNGIFGYETNFSFNRSNLAATLQQSLNENHGYINNISFGQDYFMKFWNAGNPSIENNYSHCSFYKIKELSFGYFVSNLIEDANININNVGISRIMQISLYPIEGGKESYKLSNLEIKFNE